MERKRGRGRPTKNIQTSNNTFVNNINININNTIPDISSISIHKHKSPLESLCDNRFDHDTNYQHAIVIMKKRNIHFNPEQDMYSDLTDSERLRMLEESFKLEDDDAELRAVEPGEFTCRSCGSKRVLLKLRQLRSGDEATSQIFTCAELGCKKKWVIH